MEFIDEIKLYSLVTQFAFQPFYAFCIFLKMFQKFQNTIKDIIQLEGVGLHNGINVNLCIKPAEANFGIKFKRTDVDDSKSIIEASY